VPGPVDHVGDNPRSVLVAVGIMCPGDEQSMSEAERERRIRRMVVLADVLARKPDATPAQVAARLGISERTTQRNWPEQNGRTVNGQASLPDLAVLHAGHPLNGSKAGQEES
jgi:hypothetical protein